MSLRGGGPHGALGGRIGGGCKPRPLDLMGRRAQERPGAALTAGGSAHPGGSLIQSQGPDAEACQGTTVAGPRRLSQKGRQRLEQAPGWASRAAAWRSPPCPVACLAVQLSTHLPPRGPGLGPGRGQASRRMEPKAPWTNRYSANWDGFCRTPASACCWPAGRRAWAAQEDTRQD